jgi:hypothetical protein
LRGTSYKRLCCWIWFGWYFKTKDIITGSVSHWAAVQEDLLSFALLIGNQTGITPIISSTSSYILSDLGVNKIDLNAGTITSGTSQVIHI